MLLNEGTVCIWTTQSSLWSLAFGASLFKQTLISIFRRALQPQGINFDAVVDYTAKSIRQRRILPLEYEYHTDPSSYRLTFRSYDGRSWMSSIFLRTTLWSTTESWVAWKSLCTNAIIINYPVDYPSLVDGQRQLLQCADFSLHQSMWLRVQRCHSDDFNVKDLEDILE